MEELATFRQSDNPLYEGLAFEVDQATERLEKINYKDFDQSEDLEKKDLNSIAKIVLDRINQKLTGKDFGRKSLGIEEQVEKLIKQATSHENLCQAYLGWCPYW